MNNHASGPEINHLVILGIGFMWIPARSLGAAPPGRRNMAGGEENVSKAAGDV